jgi:hypothetical protein
MRLLFRSIAVAVAVLSTLVVAQAAQAAEPTVAAEASLTNVIRDSDMDPATATAGEFVNATASVRNLLDRRQTVQVTVALTPPGGDTYELSYPLRIGAGRTARVSLTFPILRFVPTGVYTLSVSAAGETGDPSTAEAMITIV